MTPVTPNPLASCLHKMILALSATRRQRNYYRVWYRDTIAMAIKWRHAAERERQQRLRIDQEYSEFRARIIDPAFDLAAPPSARGEVSGPSRPNLPVKPQMPPPSLVAITSEPVRPQA